MLANNRNNKNKIIVYLFKILYFFLFLNSLNTIKIHNFLLNFYVNLSIIQLKNKKKYFIQQLILLK